mgnify:FL=1
MARIRWKVRDLLQRKSMSQAELARRAGFTESQVSQMVHGKYKRVDFKTLARLCQAFGGVPVGRIIEFVPDQELPV